ncbi:hypothetical protein SAMN05216552_10386 [Pseudoduganella namucuonensis]|uniref:Uncharacterized protein n=1 Tax=Pseudoduganella namucuonensis TaxID=1035707 RepID=A0A1I7LUJ1_9BURK|nr:hypothetical protein SAMN05216552_10386 [Pseudoduganella namucuonensis]
MHAAHRRGNCENHQPPEQYSEKNKADGAKKAYPAFNDQAGQFKDRDLYIFVIDFNDEKKTGASRFSLLNEFWWEVQVSNLRPLQCECREPT